MNGPFRVVFTKHTAVIVPGRHPVAWGKNSLKNPDLTHLAKVPRHFWKLENGRVVEMTPIEKRQRLAEIENARLDTRVHKHLYPHSFKGLLAAIAAALAYYWRHL